MKQEKEILIVITNKYTTPLWYGLLQVGVIEPSHAFIPSISLPNKEQTSKLIDSLEFQLLFDVTTFLLLGVHLLGRVVTVCAGFFVTGALLAGFGGALDDGDTAGVDVSMYML